MTSTANDSLLILLGILSGMLGVVVYVWIAVALAGLFRKTGEQPWQAWVPLLNLGVVLRLGGFSPWLVLIGLVPGAGQLALWVLLVISAHRIGTRFGVGPGMTVLAALLFVVWASILGLGPAQSSSASSSAAAGRNPGRRPAPEPPPWVFSPPMSDPEPAAAADAPDSSPPAPVVSRPNEDAEDREGTPTALQPSPWAPPSPFAPPADAPAPAPAAASSGPTEEDSAPTSAESDRFAPPARRLSASFLDLSSQPVTAPSPTAPPSEPAIPAAPSDASAPVPPASDAPEQSDPAEGPAPAQQPEADSRATRVSAGAETPPLTTPPAPAVPAARSDEDARWPSEIDDVSAISPSPFPSRAASARPGVVPSMADPDASGSPVQGRRTWDAVSAAPRARMPFASDPDDFPELSGEVSAVIGSPSAGAPRTAQAAVPLQQRRAEVADESDDVDHTVVVARRRSVWQLVPPSGAGVPLVSEVVIIGRQPVADPAHPRAQLVAVEDRTRTMSKTHARLELRSDTWHLIDLHSTNGVVLMSFMDAEIELAPGTEAPAGERFLLGDAELRLERPES